jgi:predicted DCC family thiol-disulfide oxidoreductase YuxK
VNDQPFQLLVLFDGDCALCNGGVRFLLEHERDSALRFASLQSPLGCRIQEEVRDSREPLDSILVRDGALVLRESDAILHLARHLRVPWSLVALGTIIPKPLRDGLYRWFARNRHRWFGAAKGCARLREEWKDRFLDTEADGP